MSFHCSPHLSIIKCVLEDISAKNIEKSNCTVALILHHHNGTQEHLFVITLFYYLSFDHKLINFYVATEDLILGPLLLEAVFGFHTVQY